MSCFTDIFGVKLNKTEYFFKTKNVKIYLQIN